MSCQIIYGAIVCAQNTQDYAIMDHLGKTWHFEFSERFGPLLLTPKERSVSDRQPDENKEFKPFWKVFKKWNSKRLKAAPQPPQGDKK